MAKFTSQDFKVERPIGFNTNKKKSIPKPEVSKSTQEEWEKDQQREQRKQLSLRNNRIEQQKMLPLLNEIKIAIENPVKIDRVKLREIFIIWALKIGFPSQKAYNFLETTGDYIYFARAAYNMFLGLDSTCKAHLKSKWKRDRKWEKSLQKKSKKQLEIDSVVQGFLGTSEFDEEV